MIKNVVFDFGQVLVKFDPAYIVGQFVTDPADAALLTTVLFDRLYWDPSDAGAISDEELLAACRQRVPERLWEMLPKIYYNWIYNLPEIEGMSDLIEHIKAEYGVRVFLLSNISQYFADHAHEIPILRHVEKCIFSAVCKKTKPSREIFAHLCNECRILPQETLFIDDSPKNTKGAEDFGISAYLFDGNAAKLKAFLHTVL